MDLTAPRLPLTLGTPPPVPMRPPLSPARVRAVYDRLGDAQDAKAFYAPAAHADLLAHGGFGEARAVFEFGCGTGRFAERLLADALPPDARYDGVDLSPVMAARARERLRPWAARAAVRVANGDPVIGAPDGAFDRVVSLYVLDILSDANIARFAGEAWRVLAPGGRACLVSLARGATPWARAVMAGWRAAYRLAPETVGGCRPVALAPAFGPGRWTTLHRRVVAVRGVSSEVLVARKEAA